MATYRATEGPSERGVIQLREPTETQIRLFLEAQRSLPFSYPEVGASRDGAPPGYPTNRRRGRLGTGDKAFRRAVEALRRWEMYQLGWTKLCWPDAPSPRARSWASSATTS